MHGSSLAWNFQRTGTILHIYIVIVYTYILQQESTPVECVPPALHRMGGLCLWGLPERDPSSSGSSGRIREAEKHEIFASRLWWPLFFMTYFHRAGGPWPPSAPWIRYCPSGQRPPTLDREPLKGTWDQAARQKVT